MNDSANNSYRGNVIHRSTKCTSKMNIFLNLNIKLRLEQKHLN